MALLEKHAGHAFFRVVQESVVRCKSYLLRLSVEQGTSKVWGQSFFKGNYVVDVISHRKVNVGNLNVDLKKDLQNLKMCSAKS